MLNKILIILFLFVASVSTQAATTNIIGATNSITLTIDPAVETNIVSYDVSQVWNTTNLIIKNFTNTLFFTFTNLVPSQSYTFSAQAINSFGARSDWSEGLYVLTKPSIPTNLRAITNALQSSISPNGPWLTVTDHVITVNTSSSNLFYRGKLTF